MERKRPIFRFEGTFLKVCWSLREAAAIAQRRITYIGERSVKFWTLDKKLGRRVNSSAHWKSSSTAGPNTFLTVITTQFGTLVCSPRAR